MTKQIFHIDRFGWDVVVFYDVMPRDADVVLRELQIIADNKESVLRANKLIQKGDYNTGFTYSNYEQRRSVMAISRTEDAMQFYNTLQHEQRHLETHIAKAFNLDPFGEELCYLAGDIAMKMFSVCGSMLCDCCRKKYRVPLHM